MDSKQLWLQTRVAWLVILIEEATDKTFKRQLQVLWKVYKCLFGHSIYVLSYWFIILHCCAKNFCLSLTGGVTILIAEQWILTLESDEEAEELDLLDSFLLLSSSSTSISPSTRLSRSSSSLKRVFFNLESGNYSFSTRVGFSQHFVNSIETNFSYFLKNQFCVILVLSKDDAENFLLFGFSCVFPSLHFVSSRSIRKIEPSFWDSSSSLHPPPPLSSLEGGSLTVTTPLSGSAWAYIVFSSFGGERLMTTPSCRVGRAVGPPWNIYLAFCSRFWANFLTNYDLMGCIYYGWYMCPKTPSQICCEIHSQECRPW